MSRSAEKDNSLATNRRSLSLLLVACALVCSALWLYSGQGQTLNLNDFLVYWSAGRQLALGGNPYSAPEVLTLERSIGYRKPTAFVLRNPPWTLPVVLPFGLLRFGTAQFCWLILGLLALLLSVYWLIPLNAAPGKDPPAGWIAAGLFVPAGVALAIGQIGPLVLLGIAGFLRFETAKRDLSAGAFLLLAAFKPHLLVPFWLAVTLWSIHSRRWRIIAGFLATLLTASLAAYLIDHQAVGQYVALWRQGEIVREFIPTLSGLILLAAGTSRYWLQFLPSVLAVVWLLGHWLRHREDWEWKEQIPILLLISLLATSYSFPFDQILLLPCVLQIVARFNDARHGTVTAAAVSYIAINAVLLAFILMHRTTFWYLWTIPAWLAWYMLVSRALRPISRPELSS